MRQQTARLTGRALICAAIAFHLHVGASAPPVEFLLRGYAATAENLRSGSFDLTIAESRFVADDEGDVKEVALFPKEQHFVSDGDSVYMRHNGGGFSGASLTATEGEYESVSHQGRSTILDHTHKSVYIHPDGESGILFDPRQHCGLLESEVLLRQFDADPSSVKVIGMEETFGVQCYVLEAMEHDGRNYRRLWLDPGHGFLARKTLVWGSQTPPDEDADAFFETEIPEVFEVAPSVWAPRTVVEEGFKGYPGGVHFRRSLSYKSVDISSPIPKDIFVLERPEGYYLHDLVFGLHYLPENLQAEEIERQTKLDMKGDVISAPEELEQQPLAPSGGQEAATQQPETPPDPLEEDSPRQSRALLVGAAAVVCAAAAGLRFRRSLHRNANR